MDAMKSFNDKSLLKSKPAQFKKIEMSENDNSSLKSKPA